MLIPMKVDGIETNRIQKLTGEHGFTQTFFTDARVPASGLMGKEGEGWKVAMQTLEYERGARIGQAGGYVMTESDPFAIVDMARSSTRNGKPVMEDPVLREKMVEYLMDIQAMSMNATRRHMPPLNQDRPMGLSLMNKLQSTELIRELNEFALTLQGPKAGYFVGDPNAVDKGIWARGYLNAFSATIGGGTSQIQRNIIGEHVLGLPKSN